MVVLGIITTVIVCGFAIGAIIVNNDDRLFRK